jgi:endonuclease YncB( thermonuclease family)
LCAGAKVEAARARSRPSPHEREYVANTYATTNRNREYTNVNVMTFQSIDGWAVIDGYQPDGDTLRFVPDHLPRVLALPRGERVAAAVDTSVAVRLEGIDAPELHYEGREQPAARPALAALLREIGWPPVASRQPSPPHATPRVSRGAVAPPHPAPPAPLPPRGARVRVVTRSCDAHGRVIGYVFAASSASATTSSSSSSSATARIVPIDRSVNARLLAAGVVYPLAYDSQPPAERARFAALAAVARREGRGVWSRDRSRDGFALRSEASLGAHGALVFPKLFRRSVAFFREAARGVGFREWLRQSSGADDAVRVAGGAWRRLSDLLTEREGLLRVVPDLLDVTFAEA